MPLHTTPRSSRKLHLSLSITPGPMVLTRKGPGSRARVRERAASGAKVAVTIESPARGRMATQPVRKVIGLQGPHLRGGVARAGPVSEELAVQEDFRGEVL